MAKDATLTITGTTILDFTGCGSTLNIGSLLLTDDTADFHIGGRGQRQHLVQGLITTDVRHIHSLKKRCLDSIRDADAVRQALDFVAGILPAENLMRELRPRSQTGIYDFIGLGKEGMVRRADTEQRLASSEVRTDSGHLFLRRKAAAGKKHQQIRILQRFDEPCKVMHLRLVTINDRDVMPQRPEFLLRKLTHRPRRFIVVGIFDRHDGNVRSGRGTGEKGEAEENASHGRI